MKAVFYFNSAQEVTLELLHSIKASFESRPIALIVEDSTQTEELSSEQKSILDNRMEEPETHCLSAEQSIDFLRKKYAL